MEGESSFFRKGLNPETPEKQKILGAATDQAKEIIARRQEIAADKRARKEAAKGSEKM